MGKITHLPGTDTFTPAQALHSALAFTEAGAEDELKEVCIVGQTADGDFLIRSSRMSVRDALWLAEQLRMYALGI